MKTFFFSFAILINFVAFAQFNCQSAKSVFKTAAATPPVNNNAKSDTLDVLHYHLDLDLSAITNNDFAGTAEIKFVSKMNGISSLNLDFITMMVDSVWFNNTTSCTYAYANGPLLNVQLPSAQNVNDTFTLHVKYHGTPAIDGSNWGGFHRANPYYFNLGVGFNANPHTYGRSWFPCFDNFVERSTFSFSVKTEGGRKAYCNGIRTLVDSTTFGGDTLVSHWEMTEEIPTYLASLAVSNYAELRHTHANKPFLIVARPGDTANAKSAFANLDAIYDVFVKNYGPYHWQKVGYALTTIGAMEHATSIHFPVSSLSAEDIIAHELAHHWFGNLITCETAGDMWINEGMAEFLSHQYLEEVYDRETYLEKVIDNHSYVIQYAAVQDGSHLALYDLPNELTYGTHTYQKGAMVGHNLRGYLGDSLFFSGLTQLLQNNAFADINSIEFRDQLSQITGYDLTSFFDDWVFNPGYPDFNIDSFYVQVSSLPEDVATVRVSQRMLATNKPFTNVPLQITLRDALGNQQTFDVLFEGADTNYQFSIPFSAGWANINENDHIFTGVSSRNYNIKTPGFIDDNRTKMRITTGPIQDSVQLRIEHHWAGPSVRGNENFRVSSKRYWRVSGYFPPSFKPEARLEFSSFASSGNLDDDLLQNGEDSLILVYRQDATQPWAEYSHYTKDYVGSPTNKFGRIKITALIPGEYAFANGETIFGVYEENIANEIRIFPNPANDVLHVDYSNHPEASTWQIVDAKGVEILTGKKLKAETDITINIEKMAAGAYLFCTDFGCVKFMVH